MGLYGSPELMKWFTTAHAKHPQKLDMGKVVSDIKKSWRYPYELIGELVSKITRSMDTGLWNRL